VSLLKDALWTVKSVLPGAGLAAVFLAAYVVLEPRPSAAPASGAWSGPPGHPYDATWCPFLAYDMASDSFRCADERGKPIPTQRGDMPFCPYLVQDHVLDGFRCAEYDKDGLLVKRVWLPGPGP